VSNPKNFDEAKRERALKLLEESDSELAETIRDKLKEREDRKQTTRVFRLPVNPSIIPPKKAGSMLQVWPLSIDRSFWEDWAFVKWQALRRNPLYRRSIKRAYKLNPAIFQSTLSHLFQDYSPPSKPFKNPFFAWCIWAIHQSVRMKTSDQIEIEVTERLMAEEFSTKKINLWPVRPDVCFPHPYFLDKLRPVPFAIPVKPVDRKDKVPLYAVLAKTGLQKPKYLWLDISLPKDVLRRAASEYLRELRSILRQKHQVFNLKSVLSSVQQQIPRRAVSLHAEKVPYWFAAWDLREAGLEFPQIAGYLFPKEYDPNDPDGYPTLHGGTKYLAVQRVQDYYDQAKLLINLITDPPANSIT
jgi:hypothetical protein